MRPRYCARSWSTSGLKLSRSVAEVQPVKSSDLPSFFFFVLVVIFAVFLDFLVEIVIIEVVVFVVGRVEVLPHVLSCYGLGGVRVTGLAAVAAASPEAAAAAGAWAVGAGVVAPGVAGGAGGLAPGADVYVVQK
jgi:hypothetical protein